MPKDTKELEENSKEQIDSSAVLINSEAPPQDNTIYSFHYSEDDEERGWADWLDLTKNQKIFLCILIFIVVCIIGIAIFIPLEALGYVSIPIDSLYSKNHSENAIDLNNTSPMPSMNDFDYPEEP